MVARKHYCGWSSISIVQFILELFKSFFLDYCVLHLLSVVILTLKLYGN